MAVVICIKAFGDLKPGDETEIPDGAEVSPHYFALKAPKNPAATKPTDPPKPPGSTA